MKTWMKAALCISLSFMCVFSFVGYAAINSELIVHGVAEAEPPDALFITSVSGGNCIDADTLAYSGTVVSSNVTLRENSDGVFEAFYHITVFNNTDVSYYYVAKVRGTYSLPDGTIVSYSNENIEMQEDISFAEEVTAGERRTFTVHVYFSDNATDTSDKTLFSIIEYQFQTTKPENKDEAAVSGVLARFPEILNTPAEYNQLISAMNDISWNRLSSSYIGNVVNASDQDSAAIQELFGESMVLNIDGEDKPVTIMIKRENVDGNGNTGENPGAWFNGGREMTLYITADTLSGAGSYVPIYAVVYTKDKGSDTWYQLGTTVSGEAKVVSYIGGNGTGSFDTDTWRSDGKTISQIVQALS